jgi:hypothetical protein
VFEEDVPTMASIERTAYPRYRRFLTPHELRTDYTLTEDERVWVDTVTRGDNRRLCCALLLKAAQHLHYFPAIKEIPPAIIHHLRVTLDLPPTTTPTVSVRTLYTYHRLIRQRLGLISHGMTVRHMAAVAVHRAAQVMDNRADLINVAIEELVKQHAELPAFSTLNKLARRVRSIVNAGYFQQVLARLSPAEQQHLDSLLQPDGDGRTRYDQLKRIPKRASYANLDEWLVHLQWLDSLGAFRAHLDGIPPRKIQHFAAEAKVLDAHEIKDLRPPHRSTVLAALIAHAQAKARDGLVELFRKRMAAFHKMARARLEQLQLAHQEEIDRLIATFSDVLDVLDEAPAAQEALQRISHILIPAGGPKDLIASCDAIRAYSSNNHHGLVWEFYNTHRSLLYRMLDALVLRSTSQDQSLIQAVEYLKANRNRTAKLLPPTLDLSFASEPWQRVVVTRKDGQTLFVRKHLEACIFSCLAAELKSGDLAVERSEEYTAIFSRFIPCGTWEAIYIIDGLLNNRSDIHPRKVHADTQGQSTTVFALTHLLGIELLPRIRNWKDLRFYKADEKTTYKQIERLFGGVIDWDYLKRHWQDLMQVVISIQEGKISSAMLLRKLGHESRKNRLYRVFRELGRVIRTLYLLRYISDQELRAEITAGCNKVESYNRFVKWLFFGSESTIMDHDETITKRGLSARLTSYAPPV